MATQQLGLRFNVVGVIPAATLIVFVAAILMSGAPDRSPSPERLSSALSALSVLDVTLVVAVAIVLAMLLHPFLFQFVQALEGYWAPIGPLGVAAEMGRTRHAARRTDLYEAARAIEPSGWWQRHFDYLLDQHREHAGRLFATFPEASWGIMPTRLGNELRRAERLAGDRYGLEAIEVIPRLYPLMPATMVRTIDDARNELDVAASFVFVWLTATGVGFVALWPYGPWLVIPLVTYLLAYLSYLGAVGAARYYGQTLTWAIDLYRFQLLEQLRIDLPKTHCEELEKNPHLKAIFGGQYVRDGGGSPPDVGAYQHPEPSRTLAAPSAGDEALP
jgi:hypothetical protein